MNLTSKTNVTSTIDLDAVLDCIIMPTLLVLGVVGNSLTIRVMMMPQCWMLSVSKSQRLHHYRFNVRTVLRLPGVLRYQLIPYRQWKVHQR